MTTDAARQSSPPQSIGEPTIACTLTAGSMKDRLTAWKDLLAGVGRRDAVDGGVRCVFAAGADTGALMRLVSAEHECCPFFRFAITVDSRGIALEVRAPADASAVVTAMFGEPS